MPLAATVNMRSGQFGHWSKEKWEQIYEYFNERKFDVILLSEFKTANIQQTISIARDNNYDYVGSAITGESSGTGVLISARYADQKAGCQVGDKGKYSSITLGEITWTSVYGDSRHTQKETHIIES